MWIVPNRSSSDQHSLHLASGQSPVEGAAGALPIDLLSVDLLRLYSPNSAVGDEVQEKLHDSA